LSNVIALARGPLSQAEALVMYATAAEGAARSELQSMTGLPEAAIEDALAQLVRRGLIHATGNPVRQMDARPRRLGCIHGRGPTNPRTPPTVA
jgi:DNA-binding MarR family transcriptional regulator